MKRPRAAGWIRRGGGDAVEYASLCVLSYDRPGFVFEAIRSARDNAGYPCEVVVHDDGSTDPAVGAGLQAMLASGDISRLVMNPPGRNEGVGAAFNRAAAVATGDPVVKIDQDLLFNPGWLDRVVGWLARDGKVGMFGLFKYYTDPVDWRKMRHRTPTLLDDEPEGYSYVDDFVGSAMVIPRWILNGFGPFPEHSDAFAEDVEYKKMLQAGGHELALPDDDLAVNRGFGVGPSTVAVYGDDGALTASKIHHGTTIFP